MLMAPPVKLNDGRLFLVKSKLMQPIKLLMVFPKIFSGSHILQDRVDSCFVKDIRFKSPNPYLMLIDGEVVRGLEPRVSVLEKSWKLYLSRAKREKADLI